MGIVERKVPITLTLKEKELVLIEKALTVYRDNLMKTERNSMAGGSKALVPFEWGDAQKLMDKLSNEKNIHRGRIKWNNFLKK